MKKKILVVDDSALMRRVLCDIINSDDRFEVVDTANDGLEGFKLIVDNKYDAIVLDVYMPKMTGLQMLEELQKAHVPCKVMMASTTTGEGARETMTALELGAIDFIKKPENVADARHSEFRERFLGILNTVACARTPSAISRPRQTAPKTGPVFTTRYDVNFHTTADKLAEQRRTASAAGSSLRRTTQASAKPEKNVVDRPTPVSGGKIVAIASSTGGPRALQEVLPYLPADLNAPVLLVQHMPKGFTASLADRMDELSAISVSEAKDGERISNGHVYIAEGGKHMNLEKRRDGYYIKYSDEPAREGVKPCANYMYESLINCDFREVVCVVLTGMGADGTAGIKNLNEKKKIYVIGQDEESSTVYGMPKAIAKTGLVNEVVSLEKVAEQITKNVGVH